jgi:uncharacterized membrane protein YkoI
MTGSRALCRAALALGAVLCLTGSAFASAGGVKQATRALATARQEAPRSAPYDLERERYRGARAWEVKLAATSGRVAKVYVSRNGRRVLGSRPGGRWDGDARRARRASVGLARALRIAARRASGRLVEAEIDRERGRVVWSVTFAAGRVETEVSVDASSAAVVEVENEVEDEDD